MRHPFSLSSRPRRFSHSIPILIFGLVLTAGVALFAFFQPGVLITVNSRIYDIFLEALPVRTPSPVPVIVDIDDRSLNHYGQWPWPRYRMARLLERIANLHPRSVALDILFPEPDRMSPGYLNRQMARDFNLRLNLSNVPKNLRDNDAILAHTLKKGPFVLGYKFAFGTKGKGSTGCRLHPAPVFVVRLKGAPATGLPLQHPTHAICNLPKLARAVSTSGFLNAMTDRDGVLRRVPLLMAFHGRIYPSLALAAMLRAFKVRQLVLRIGTDGTGSLVFGNRVIPLDEQGNLLIRFLGPGHTFQHVSAASIMNGTVNRGQIENHIVFIGTLAAGLSDFHATPLDPVYPGTEVHATVVDNIVQGDFLQRPQWIRGMELMIGVLVGILSVVLLTFSRAVTGMLIFGLSAWGMWFVAKGFFERQGIFVSPVIPFLMLAVNFSFLSALKFWREERTSKKRERELADVQAMTLETIVALIETRHFETGGHVKRTQYYVKHLARCMQKNKKYRQILDDNTVELLFRSSPLHDVGKIGVPDAVLKKPGRLNAEEYEVMKRHAEYGKIIFDVAEGKLGHNSFLSIARTIAYTHHEKWDGSGYPQGLKGEEIPLFGRIMAVADIYDALVSKRVYKTPMPHDQAVTFIREKGGKELDPDVVEAFVMVQDEFREIAERFADGRRSPIDVIASSLINPPSLPAGESTHGAPYEEGIKN